MPLKGFCLYYALLGLMQTTTSVVVLIAFARVRGRLLDMGARRRAIRESPLRGRGTGRPLRHRHERQ